MRLHCGVRWLSASTRGGASGAIHQRVVQRQITGAVTRSHCQLRDRNAALAAGRMDLAKRPLLAEERYLYPALPGAVQPIKRSPNAQRRRQPAPEGAQRLEGTNKGHDSGEAMALVGVRLTAQLGDKLASSLTGVDALDVPNCIYKGSSVEEVVGVSAS
jgi:hypothetical protein